MLISRWLRDVTLSLVSSQPSSQCGDYNSAMLDAMLAPTDGVLRIPGTGQCCNMLDDCLIRVAKRIDCEIISTVLGLRGRPG